MKQNNKKDTNVLLVKTANAITVAKRPQIAIMSKQQAHAARPPTGPSAATRGLTIVECLAYTHTRVSTILVKKLKRYIYK